MNWIKVGRAEEFGPGFHVRSQGRVRFILAVIDGDMWAFDPVCPHAGGPLELAETQGQVIACPLHGWRFDLARGGCELHGYRPLRMYDIRVDAGMVYVALPDAAGLAPVATAGASS